MGAGSSTSYAVTASGEGYAWGFGENLQLTNGEEKDELVPVLMTGQQLDGRRVLQVRRRAKQAIRHQTGCFSKGFLFPFACAKVSGGGQHAVILAAGEAQAVGAAAAVPTPATQ